MDKQQISKMIEDYIRRHYSPTRRQREYVQMKAAELKEALKGASCLSQKHSSFVSGSYARYTATNPIEDLDIVFFLDEERITDPKQQAQACLEEIKLALDSHYRNEAGVEVQAHSIKVDFKSPPAEFSRGFSMDIVPALWQEPPLILVPEILLKSRRERSSYKSDHSIEWIKSAPQAYIELAKEIDEASGGSFRKTIKTLKAIKGSWKSKHGDGFKLKSFHLEVMCLEYFGGNPKVNTLKALLDLSDQIPEGLDRPQYQDLADPKAYIDAYVKDLSNQEKA